MMPLSKRKKNQYFMLVFGNLLQGKILSSGTSIESLTFQKFCHHPLLFRPIFSTDNINSDKNKMERFLHAGRFSIASIYAPICFPPLPLIALKHLGGGAAPTVAAVGSLRSIDPDRIILKKIILTGYELPDNTCPIISCNILLLFPLMTLKSATFV